MIYLWLWALAWKGGTFGWVYLFKPSDDHKRLQSMAPSKISIFPTIILAFILKK
jgi:hypothetical protein